MDILRYELAILKIELATDIVNILSFTYEILIDCNFIWAANQVDKKMMDVIRWADQVIIDSDNGANE
jgi:hypothetical protein